jgi:RNA polymerase sigma factor (sigma-70 family)
MTVAAAKPPVRRARNGASRRRDLTPAERDERAALVAECVPAAHLWAHKVFARYPWLDRDELIAEALFILAKAADYFDPSRGLKFVTLCYTVLPRHLWRYADAETRHQRAEGACFSEASSADDGLDPFEDSIPDDGLRDIVEAAGLRERIEIVRRQCYPREWRVLFGRFAEGKSLREVARSMKMSTERARQLQWRAIGRLRAAAARKAKASP